MRSPVFKRLFDLVVAIPAFVLTLPLQAVIATLVASKLGRPVLFRQERPGLHGKSFELIKFRTMLPVDPDRGQVDDESRMTPLGAKLRATSLDELPTLINIIRGDMSLVGPRPLLVRYLNRYTPEQARRHEVRPGLTGLAQISGRNAIAWDDKLALDVEYVDRRSMMLDVRILVATARQVVRQDGITAPGHVTTTEFMGTAVGPESGP
ncbi:MAG TPA: sugar transferase [Nakamurella multipartita]|nr:sugar transferase [Nakamurella multipartita]